MHLQGLLQGGPGRALEANSTTCLLNIKLPTVAGYELLHPTKRPDMSRLEEEACLRDTPAQ